MRAILGQILIAVGLLTVFGCALPSQKATYQEYGQRGAFQSRSRNRDRSLEADQHFAGSKSRVNSESNAVTKDLYAATSDSDQISFKRPGSATRSVDRTDEITRVSHEDSVSDSLHSTIVSGDQVQNDQRPSSVQIVGIEFDSADDIQNPRAAQQSNKSVDSSRENDRVSGNSAKKQSGWNGYVNIDQPVQGERRSKTDSNNKSSVETVNQTNYVELPQYNGRPANSLQQSPLPWQSDLERLIVQVEQSLAQSNMNSGSHPSDHLRRQAHLRLLYMMAQRQEDALTSIPDLPAWQQEYWQQLTWAMSNSLDETRFPDPSERAAQALSPLNTAISRLRDEAPLMIRNMAFCRKISYFGNYDRFNKNEFTPGQEVLLYSEIENFVSTPSAEGEFRTLLKSLLEIVDEKGKVVWSKSFTPTEDFCRNTRRDYFHNYQFRIPEDISTGPYQLRLTLSDEISQKRVQNSLSFQVR